MHERVYEGTVKTSMRRRRCRAPSVERSACMPAKPKRPAHEARANLSPSVPSAREISGLVDALVSSANEICSRFLRIVFPRPFTPSSQVFNWDKEATQMADTWTDGNRQWRWIKPCDDEASGLTDVSDTFSDFSEDDSDPDPDLDLDLDLHPATKTRATRLLEVASYCPEEPVLCVEQYLCKCGHCAQYKTIKEDVARAVTWRAPDELARVVRILQAFSTFNEAIGYHPDMIWTADECLNTWSGDEDKAFTSFVMLEDVVPFLCATEL